jgi:formylglycine-generating enzyme required for sulfatase activity
MNWKAVGAALVLAWPPSLASAAYSWETYGGHDYALTAHGTWAQAEWEAVAAGGHLATVNDANENAWLTDFCKDSYAREYAGVANQNAAWIGFQNVGGAWAWVSGEPVTYNPTDWDPADGPVYLHGGNYVSGYGANQPPHPGDWGISDHHDQSYDHNFRGIIEVIPEPSAVGLLAFAAMAILRRRRKAMGLALLIGLAASVAPATSSAAVNIETVVVGNTGNGADTTGYGAVDYEYRVGKYEVTAGQYCAFLNAVAKTDTHELYNTNMWTHSRGCKIQRDGSSGSYTYSVDANRADRPVSDVSWGDAARFANWLHNGQRTGAQDANTTEDGAYFLNGSAGNADLMAVTRKDGWEWAIPTHDEWYKAAYHKSDGDSNNYYDYPTSSDAIPSNQLVGPNDPGNNATWYDQGYTVGSPYWRTEAGAHENSESPYVALDMAGNVWEWSEGVFDDSHRIRCGGSYSDYAIDLKAGSVNYDYATLEIEDTGFRLVMVPEPATLALLALGGVAVLRKAQRT